MANISEDIKKIVCLLPLGLGAVARLQNTVLPLTLKGAYTHSISANSKTTPMPFYNNTIHFEYLQKHLARVLPLGLGATKHELKVNY